MSRVVKTGEVVKDVFPVFDEDGYSLKSGETSFTTWLWKDSVVSVIAVTIEEIGSSGEYSTSFTPDEDGVWNLQILIDYNKDVMSREYVATESDQAGVVEKINRILGLNHENIFIDNTEYDASTQLVLARVRLFDSKANCDAATDGGSETTGLLANYQLTTTWEGLNQFRVFKQTKE